MAYKAMTSIFGPGNGANINGIIYYVAFVNTSTNLTLMDFQDTLLFGTDLVTYSLGEIQQVIQTKTLAYAVTQGYTGFTVNDIAWISTNMLTPTEVVSLKSSIKRRETYSGTSNASGLYTVTFATAFSVSPNIQANLINGTDTQSTRITAISTTGFSVLVRNRTDVIGLLPSYSNVNGASLDVLITEK